MQAFDGGGGEGGPGHLPGIGSLLCGDTVTAIVEAVLLDIRLARGSKYNCPTIRVLVRCSFCILTNTYHQKNVKSSNKMVSQLVGTGPSPSQCQKIRQTVYSTYFRIFLVFSKIV